MRATIKDVAEAAGVSIKTVSRVLNKERYVHADTRANVERAMGALSFHPSLAARALAGHRSFQVALICDNPSPYYVHAMLSGARERCAADGVRLIVQPYDRGSATLAEEIASLVDQTHPDGLILTPPASDAAAVLDLLDARHIPYVRVSPGTTPGRSAHVFIDNARAAYEMTALLTAAGHRRIGFVAGHPGYAASAQRETGYARASAAAGIDLDPALVRPGRFDFASGEAAADALLALADPPTAIFAASDDMAAGVLAAAHRRGVRVPEALSVAGFDDTGLASVVWPPLTTVRQPTRDLAWAAADLLLGGGADRREARELAFTLIERRSVAAPPVDSVSPGALSGAQ